MLLSLFKVEIETDSEFEHFQDADEFEGFEEKEDKPIAEPKITIAKVPINLMLNWESYYLEILMVAGLVVYFVNYLLGLLSDILHLADYISCLIL